LDERGTELPLCAPTIVLTAEKSEKSLVVAAVQSKGPLVLDLESGSRPTSGPVRSLVLALMASALLDALADL